jgi:hypothetical protein
MSTCYTYGHNIYDPCTVKYTKWQIVRDDEFSCLIYWYKVINLWNVLPLVHVCCNGVTSYRLFYCSTPLHIQNCDIPLQWIMLSVILKHKKRKRAGWPVSALVPLTILKNPLHQLFYVYIYLFIYLYIDVHIFTSWRNVIYYSGSLYSVCFKTIHRPVTERQISEFKGL